MRDKLMKMTMDCIEKDLIKDISALGLGGGGALLTARDSVNQPKIDDIVNKACKNAKAWTEAVDKHLDRNKSVFVGSTVNVAIDKFLK